MPHPETILVGRIRAEILDHWPDAWLVKTHGSAFSTSGLPDLIVLVRSAFVALEVKAVRAGETQQSAVRRATEAQRLTLKKIATCGGVGAVVTSVDQAVEVVRRALVLRKGPEVEADE